MAYEAPYLGKGWGKKRTTYAGMLSAADEGIGNVTAALRASEALLGRDRGSGCASRVTGSRHRMRTPTPTTEQRGESIPLPSTGHDSR